MLEDKAGVALAHVLSREILAVEQDAAVIWKVEPGENAQQRRLARAGWPKQCEEFAVVHRQAHIVERAERAERFGQFFKNEGHLCFSGISMPARRREGIAEAPFEEGFDDERDNREQREKRGDRERGDEIVIVVEHFDVQRQRIGQAADVA